MKPTTKLLLVSLTMLATALTAKAQFTVYTNSTDFLNAFTGGSFTTNFASVPDFAALTNPTTFAGSYGYSFTVYSTTNDPGNSQLWGLQNTIASGVDGVSVFMDNDSLVLTNFTYAPGSGGFGIGGNWLSTDGNGEFAPQPVSVSVILSDLSSYTTNYTPADFNSTYLGFITATNLSSVTISGPGSASGYYATVANVTVVPEPSTYALLGLAAAGLAGYVIRRRRRV